MIPNDAASAGLEESRKNLLILVINYRELSLSLVRYKWLRVPATNFTKHR